ncbi:MAG: hypothetical protein JKY81_03425, partial [Colwellia sp.]|nr:hypothetical protein [Colwellia sp.]
DGVSDVNDAFPLDNSESVDTDGDGIGNNADTDDDGDGVSDVNDAFPLDNSESVDTDGDGIGNNADTDDDGDGIVDEDDSEPLNPEVGDNQAPVFAEIDSITFEATALLTEITLTDPQVTDNNLNAPTISSDLNAELALGEHVITWTATDFVGNQSTAEQFVTIVDTTAPEFEEQATFTLNAQGRLSNVANFVNVIATDMVDGDINATIVGDGLYTTGEHQITLVAIDNSGNSQNTLVNVVIVPELTTRTNLIVEAGGSYQLTVNLSGEAASYPVEVSYQVSLNGDVVNNHSMSITAGTQGQLTLNVPVEILSTDSLILELSETTNAFIGDNKQTQLQVIATNVAPQLSVTVLQNNLPVSVIDPENGVVIITTVIADVNQNDNHDINWTVNDNAFVDSNNDSNVFTFELMPSDLALGVYSLNIEVNENNTDDSFSVSRKVQIIVENLIALAENTDSDGDGISDRDEGYSDSDGDGIADYLDNDSNTMRLPSDDNSEPMQTTSGLTMSLGTHALVAGGSSSTGASFSIDDLAEIVPAGSADTDDNHYEVIGSVYNFIITGLAQQGDSVTVVIPLATGTALTESSLYRKYNTRDGWYSFVEDENNHIRSAIANASGNCPVPNDEVYSQGLTAGDNCVELVIEDGGANDADLTLNGSVEDPGAFVIELQNQAPVVELMPSYEVDEETQITLDASNSSDIEGDTLTYQWLQLSGVAVDLTDTNNAQLSFISPSVVSNEVLTFEVTVSDGIDSTSASTQVTVLQINKAPSVVIESHESSADENSIITINSQGSDPDGDALSYSWLQISGPTVTFDEINTAQVNITLPEVNSDETITVQVTVTDGDLTSSSQTSFIVTNKTEVIIVTPPKQKSSGGSMNGLIMLILGGSVLARRKLGTNALLTKVDLAT